MNDDRILEFMATVSEFMRDTDRRFEQLITVMHDGFTRVNDNFGRVNDQIAQTNQQLAQTNQQLAQLVGRVDVLTDEVRSTNQRVDDLTDEVRTLNHRMTNTFDQTGRLTETADNTGLRVTHLERQAQPSNAELDQRLQTVENLVLPKAS